MNQLPARHLLIIGEGGRFGLNLQEQLMEEGYQPLSLSYEEALHLPQSKIREYPLIVLLSCVDIKAVEQLKEPFYYSIVLALIDAEKVAIPDLIRAGVREFLMLPATSEQCLEKINQLWLKHNRNFWINFTESQQVEQLERQLDWERWKSEHSGSGKFSRLERDRALFYNLRTSLSQGAGIGMLISLLEMAEVAARKEGDQAIMPADLFDMMMSNAEMARRVIDQLNQMEEIYNDRWQIEKQSLSELHQLILSEFDNLQEQAKIRNTSFTCSKPRPNDLTIDLYYNKHLLSRAIREVLLNAMKFSPEDAPVMVYLDTSTQRRDGNIVLRALNFIRPDDDSRVGIPSELEELVFEPFHRIQPTLYEKFDTLDMGVGLSMVRNVAERQGGRVAISNVTDHCQLGNHEQNSKPSILVELKLMISSKAIE